MGKFVQFISGAICPSCKASDTIAIGKDNNIIYCVKCDFKEARPLSPNNKTNTINAVNIDDLKTT
jgi:uncharacterized metal-binding protein (TIGR02443 family)